MEQLKNGYDSCNGFICNHCDVCDIKEDCNEDCPNFRNCQVCIFIQDDKGFCS